MIDIEEFRQMLDDCETRESRLTDWERSFIDSLADRGFPPTEKQVDTLNAIWDRVTEKG